MCLPIGWRMKRTTHEDLFFLSGAVRSPAREVECAQSVEPMQHHSSDVRVGLQMVLSGIA